MGKNIVICLDGTGNQFGEKNSNVVRLFRMLERSPTEQVAYYDPGVGTMGDPTYKTWIARKINKILGLAFGRGLMRNLVEAYTYLMEHYEDGDKVFVFGFSRGAYTARAFAAFIRDCGLFERGAENMIPYAMSFFLKKAPPRNAATRPEFFKLLSSFRSTYGRKWPKDRVSEGENPWSYQLRIEFVGLFDTVKSYGWVRNPPILRNEAENASILNLRHAIAIDERRTFFRQMHWRSSKGKSCKEVWFPGVHSDVGGGYPEAESGLAKVALEWMVNEACALGMKVEPFLYTRTFADNKENGYPGPDPLGPAHESLKRAWRLVQLLPKSREKWEIYKRRRTIKCEADRAESDKRKPKDWHSNVWLVHRSVIERMSSDPSYRPPNLLIDPNDPKGWEIEETRDGPVFPVAEG